MRWIGLVLLVVAACAPAPAAEPSPIDSPSPAALPAPAPTATSRPIGKLRVFVTSDMGDQAYVLESSGGPFVVTAKIALGHMPHNIAVSPDGRWIAAADRMANAVSIVDPVELREVARVPVGHQPHDVAWRPDSGMLFVGHERDPYIARIEPLTWRPLAPLVVGVPQHDLAISPTRPNELYFTVTNSSQSDDLRVYDLATDTITKYTIDDVHDAFYTPDASEVWSTSSGFLDKPSDRVVIYDPATRTVKTQIRFPGHYPFHSMKPGRDGMYFPPAGTPLLLADHAGPSLLFVDPASRAIVGETPLGKYPYHTTYDPIGNRVLVTSWGDGAVRVIDLATRKVIQTIPVPTAHGIVAVGLP